MSEEQDQLKLIEKDLKDRALELEEKEKEIDEKEKNIQIKVKVVDKHNLFTQITEIMGNVFSMYELSVGTYAGCTEVIQDIINARQKLENNFKND